MSVILRPEFPGPHRINPWRGATPADIEHIRKQVNLCFDLFVTALEGHLGNLRENLPVGSARFAEVYLFIADARDEINGQLEKLEDQS